MPATTNTQTGAGTRAADAARTTNRKEAEMARTTKTETAATTEAEAVETPATETATETVTETAAPRVATKLRWVVAGDRDAKNRVPALGTGNGIEYALLPELEEGADWDAGVGADTWTLAVDGEAVADGLTFAKAYAEAVRLNRVVAASLLAEAAADADA